MCYLPSALDNIYAFVQEYFDVPERDAAGVDEADVGDDGGAFDVLILLLAIELPDSHQQGLLLVSDSCLPSVPGQNCELFRLFERELPKIVSGCGDAYSWNLVIIRFTCGLFLFLFPC
jgi:hypothetical protein